MKNSLPSIFIIIFFLTGCNKKNIPAYAMVLVRPGSFVMGSNTYHETDRPEHRVEISKAFYIGKYEVTYELFDQFCDELKLSRNADNGWGRNKRPVILNDFSRVIRFCNWLSEKNGFKAAYVIRGDDDILWKRKADGYRLPTEAEWEYAARGGDKSRFYKYSGSNDRDSVAWHKFNSDGKTHPVGQKKPNELGIYDMSGNLGEWCWDMFNPEYYKISPLKDPVNEKIFYPAWIRHVKRGGCYRETLSLTTTFRQASINNPTDPIIGIRLARNYYKQ